MVFLSTFQALLGMPLTRAVFAFGGRHLTRRIVVSEVVTGLLLVLPLSLLVSAMTIRFAASTFLKPKFVRCDIWTTAIITIVGDLFLEVLLPSVQCLPLEHPFSTTAPAGVGGIDDDGTGGLAIVAAAAKYFHWLARAWGFQCPVPPSQIALSAAAASEYGIGGNNDENGNAYDVARLSLLSTDAVGTLLTIRLIFMCTGIYLGESFLPVALTGGIACGKSTVANLLAATTVTVPTTGSGANNEMTATTRDSFSGGGGGGGKHSGKHPGSKSSRRQKSKSNRSSSGSASSAAASAAASNQAAAEPSFFSLDRSDEEGTFLIVDTDKIAHDILLPPDVLAARAAAAAAAAKAAASAAAAASSSGKNETDQNLFGLLGDDEDDDILLGNDSDRSYTLAASAAATATAATSTQAALRPADSVYNRVVETFGDPSENNRNILDEKTGLIDRTKLGAIVFQDKSLRKQLNRITHPRIILVMLQQLLRGIFWTHADIVCADVPLLFESGQLRRMFGIVIVVACNRKRQFARLKKRNPELTDQQCWDRINSQMPIDKKVQMADIVIWNDYDDDLEALAQDVEGVRREVMGRIYGIGMSLLQMLLLVGGSLSLAVSSKLFSSWT